MLTDAEQVLFNKHAQELREMWQARALATARDKTFMVLLSVLAHSYDTAMPVLLRTVFPGFVSIMTPFLCSAGKVVKSGAVVADVVGDDGCITRKAVLYRSETELQNDFRRLADALKLSDADRIEMFAAVRRWVVCDFRLDPAMDPQDPDAKHLVH